MTDLSDITVVDRLGERQIDQLLELYAQEWWTGTRTLENVRVMLAHTSVVVGLVNGAGDLVGFARVVTDRVYTATLLDVIVRPDLRGRGLGDVVMQRVLHHPDLAGLAWMQLNCRADKVAFYERHGFTVSTTRDHPVHGPSATMTLTWSERLSPSVH